MRTGLVVAVGMTLAVVLAACGGGTQVAGSGGDVGATLTPPAIPTTDDQMTVTLKDLTSLEDLRDLFNRDLGQTRILLLLSPA